MITRKMYQTDFMSHDNNHLLPESYLYFISKYSHINVQDIMFAILEILDPKLIVYDNRIFLADRFCVKKISEYKSLSDAQYWINLIYLSELYEHIDDDTALYIGELIINNWNQLIHEKTADSYNQAKLIIDDELGIFVTIHHE